MRLVKLTSKNRHLFEKDLGRDESAARTLIEIDKLLSRRGLEVVVVRTKPGLSYTILPVVEDCDEYDEKKAEKILRGKERACKYPYCTYYSPKATEYCCAACSGDHYDCIRLGDCKKGG